MKWFEVVAIISVMDAVWMYCCCKVSKRSKDMKIILTDVDGVRFEIYADMIDGVFNRGKYTEITTYMGETYSVLETVAEVLAARRGY